MSKVESKFFKGIEYIQLKDLPEKQKSGFIGWLEKDNIINIQIGEKIEKDCVQYADYLYWYENQQASPKKNNKSKESKTTGKSVNLAFE